MRNSRISKWDNIRFFLIFCVVLGHAGGAFVSKSYLVARAQFWVYLFHMPAFLFLSGLFSKKTVAKKKWGKVVPYLFLFFLMKIVSFFVTVWLNGIGHASLNFFSETGVPWYALAIFWCYVITILVQNVHPAYVLTVSLLLSFFAGYSDQIGAFLVLQRSIVFFPFFYAGYLIDQKRLKRILERGSVRLASLFVLAFSLFISFRYYDNLSFWRSLFRARYTYEQIGAPVSYAWGWSWRLIGYLISAVLMLAIFSLIPDRWTPLTVLGQKTLSVFAFHYPVIRIVYGKLPQVKSWIGSNPIALHCLLFSFCVVLFTAVPLFDWPLRKLMNVPGKPEKHA